MNDKELITSEYDSHSNRKKKRCQACCSDWNLHEHHITFRSKFGKREREQQEHPDNKIILCAKCHEKIHARKLYIIRTRSGGIRFVDERSMKYIQEQRRSQ